MLRTALLMATLALSGCGRGDAATVAGGGSADADLQKMASAHWDASTERIKQREVYATSDPIAWAAVISARTCRMLSVSDSDKLSTVLPIMLATDAEFLASDRPADLGELDAAAWETAYIDALKLTELRLRAAGDAKHANLIASHNKGLKR